MSMTYSKGAVNCSTASSSSASSSNSLAFLFPVFLFVSVFAKAVWSHFLTLRSVECNVVWRERPNVLEEGGLDAGAAGAAASFRL